MPFGQIFSRDTQAIFYNWKANPVQRMLDFDFLCGKYMVAPCLTSYAVCHPVDGNKTIFGGKALS